MGSTKLWLPSLRSVDSHRGGLSRVLLGHERFSSFSGSNFLYFFHGSLSIGMLGTVALVPAKIWGAGARVRAWLELFRSESSPW